MRVLSLASVASNIEDAKIDHFLRALLPTLCDLVIALQYELNGLSLLCRQLHRGGAVQHVVHPEQRAVGGGQEHLAGGHRRLPPQHGRRIRVSQSVSRTLGKADAER